MNVVQYFRVIRRRWKLVAALAALGAIVAFMLAPRPRSLSALDGPSSYVATHTMFANSAATVGSVAAPVNLAQTPLLVTGGDVVDRVATATGEDPNILLANVIAQSNPALNTVDITYHDPDGVKAAEIADEFALQLTNALNDLETQRATQQITTLQQQRDQLRYIYSTLEGDPEDPLVKTKSQALLNQLNDVEAQLQQINQLPGSDPYLLTLRSATSVPVTDAEYAALIEATTQTQANNKSASGTALQTQSDLISDRGQAGVNPWLATLGGAVLGALIGVGVALTINRLDPRLFTKEDTEEATGFPVIAEVPNLDRAHRQSSSVMSRDAPYSRYAESFHALRSSLLFVQHTGRVPGQPPKPTLDTTSPYVDSTSTIEKLGTTIMVTSPGPGEGKTTTVANLAAVMAEDGSKVLVVNCDFRRPRLHLYLDAPNESRKVVDTSIPGVKLVAGVVSNHAKSSPAEVLAAQRHLVTTARTMFDYILLDTAPILTTTDASEILSVTDMVVVILRAGKTTAESADRAAELLERYQAPVVGGIVVGASDAPSSRYYYYYSDEASLPGSTRPTEGDPFAQMRSSGEPAKDTSTESSGTPPDDEPERESDGDESLSDNADSGRRNEVGTAADAPTT